MMTIFFNLVNSFMKVSVYKCSFTNFPFTFRFIEKLQQDIPGNGVKQQLEILCNIYALFLLHKQLGDFLSTGCITPKQASLANDQLRSLYSQVCFPNCKSNTMVIYLYFKITVFPKIPNVPLLY